MAGIDPGLIRKILRKPKQIIYRGVMRCMTLTAFHKGRINPEWKEILFTIADQKQTIQTCRMVRSFLRQPIRQKKKALLQDDPSVPTVICVEKDNLVFLKKFLPYYRELGIRHFFMIDNNSTDGSFEFLLGEDDVTLYSAPFPFEHSAKAGWLLQAIRETGTDRRYLRLDADEFLTWQGMEGSDITGLIGSMERCRMGTLRAVMADMYPDRQLNGQPESGGDFMDIFIRFDDSSSYDIDPETGNIYGGMRKRLFGAKLRMDKYILADPSAGYYPMDNHSMTGVRNPEDTACCCMLRHYKFLSDRNASGPHANRSGYASQSEIEKYAHPEDLEIDPVYEHSIVYESSQSLREMHLIRPLSADQYKAVREGAAHG